MYATEKYVKMEAKELRESINQLAADLGGDIRYLDERISDLKQQLVELQQQLQEFNRNADE